jgi:hypothetical protein
MIYVLNWFVCYRVVFYQHWSVLVCWQRGRCELREYMNCELCELCKLCELRELRELCELCEVCELCELC